MIYTHIAAALLAAALAATGTYKVEEWRFASKEKDRVEQQLENERSQAKATLKKAEAVTIAQNASITRQIILRNDANASRDSLIRLQQSTDSALQTSRTNIDACIERTTTLSELLNTSAKEYQRLGEKADRHTSDIKTLIDAWPK